MHCTGYCVLAALMAGSIIAAMVGYNTSAQKLFQHSLSPEQIHHYQEIKKQRLTIFLQGLAIGAAIAVGYWFFVRDYMYTPTMNLCIVSAIVLGVSFLYYYLSPKKMMLNYLDTPEQVHLYTELYKEYQLRSSWGMVIGIIAVLAIVFFSGR